MTDTPTSARHTFIVPRCEADPRILHADAHLLVVDKPSGLLSVPGRHPANRDSLITRLQREWPDALVVHRLDMDTSGLMVVARGTAAHRALSRQFQDRHVGKTYRAIVAGHLSPHAGTADFPLITDWPNRPLQKICPTHGKPATTRYKVTEHWQSPATSAVTLHPITGRSHQLRVHMMALGHPILGDNFYADPIARTLAGRLMLHACELAFRHPETGEQLRFASEPQWCWPSAVTGHVTA